MKQFTKVQELADFEVLIDLVHGKAEAAAREKQTEELFRATDWLRRAQELKIRHEDLLRHIDRLAREWSSIGQEQITMSPSNVPAQKINELNDLSESGGKQRARECRGAYLDRERKRGNLLTKKQTAYYRKSSDGSVVGITWSTENKGKPYPWFFNLIEGRFEEAILLCETDKQSVQIIHLPKTFLERYDKQMSRGSNGRIMFNVVKRGRDYFLQLPNPVGAVDISSYVENESLICPRHSFA